MFDYRYHALSLMAVFLALGIGILLGVTIGDSLVSEADRDLRGSLNDDLRRVSAERAEARDQLDRRERLLREVVPELISGRLTGERVAVLGLGGLPGEVQSAAEEAVEGAGATVDSVTTIETPGRLEALAEAAGTVPGGDDPVAEATSLGRRVGRAIGRGGELAERLDRELGSFDGEYGGADAVAIHHAPPEPGEGGGERGAAEREVREAFETAVLEGFRDAEVRIIGIELFATEPSQVPFYEDNRLSSVDSVDLPGGRLALVLALEGTDGTYGFKRTADRPAPDLDDPATGR